MLSRMVFIPRLVRSFSLLQYPMSDQNNSTADDDGSMWIVYEAPHDFPDKYVARRLHLSRPTSDFVVGDTLIDVRSKLPKGLFRIERSDRDDPQIRESWI
jgi:hypothetical protein